MNDLPHITNSRVCRTFIFADDVFLLFRGNQNFLEVFESDINSCLDRFLCWADVNSLAVNSSKTKALLFGPRNRLSIDLNVFLGQAEIEFVNQHRCLGIILDSDLSFKTHINVLSGRIWASLRKIYCANMFLPFRIKTTLAHALLMSQLLYGLEVVSGSIGSCLVKLKRIVNAIVRFVFNVRRRDHISGYVHRFLGCSFKNFVAYRNLALFYNVVKRAMPLPLRRSFIFSRSTRNPQIFIPRIYRSIYSRSFLVRIARSWNCLPYELRIFSHSNNVFRLKLLQHFSILNL